MLLMTSVSARGHAHQAESAGFSGYLNKPVRETRLFECIREIFSDRAEGPKSAKPIITRHTVHEAGRASVPHILLVDDNVSKERFVSLSSTIKTDFPARSHGGAEPPSERAATGKRAVNQNTEPLPSTE